MQAIYVRKRDRHTGRMKGLYPASAGRAPVGGNRAARRERVTHSHSDIGGSAGGWLRRTVYRITFSLYSLINPNHYCPPSRHFGNHTKPVCKKGKRQN